jgi:hypothetical protein
MDTDAGALPTRPGAPAERDHPRMDTPNVLWFFGAFAIGFASSELIAVVPGSHRRIWELLAALGFLAAYALGCFVLLRGGWWIPAGLAAALAVSTVPAVGIGFFALIGTLPDSSTFDATQHFSWSVFLIGIATIVAGLVAFAVTRFSFLFFTVTVSSSLTAQLLVPGFTDHPSGDPHLVTAIVTGSALIAVGIALDAAGRRRDAFWFHVIGFFNVAVALGYYAAPFTGDTNRGWIPMAIVGALVLLLSAPLRRATWALYGILGFYSALFHWLTNGLNASSAGYAAILLGIGLSLFLLGLVLHRYGRVWESRRATIAS